MDETESIRDWLKDDSRTAKYAGPLTDGTSQTVLVAVAVICLAWATKRKGSLTLVEERMKQKRASNSRKRFQN